MLQRITPQLTCAEMAVYNDGCCCAMKDTLPVGERKIHVEWLVEVKLETLKEVWLQAHCRAGRVPLQAEFQLVGSIMMN